MDAADLKTVEAVARHGSMNKAAAELNTVQSNVTARIRALEDELGVALFQRHARGVVITPAGQRVLPFADRMAKLVADARQAALDDGEPNGTLVLGSLETTMALRLSPILTRYSKTYPDVQLVVSSGTTAGLLRDVIASRLDGAFVAGPVVHPDLLQETAFKEELVLVTAPSISSLRDLVNVGDLRTVVFQSGCSYRQRLESYLGGRGIIVARSLEFGSLDAILSCVGAGVGITLLPEGVVAEAARAGQVTLHRLPQAVAKVQTLFIRRRDGYPSSAMTAFLAMSRDLHRRAALVA